MRTGSVKWFRAEKGFGFSTPDQAGNALFVDHTAIGGGYHSLNEGSVSVDREPGPKGLKAIHVSGRADSSRPRAVCGHPSRLRLVPAHGAVAKNVAR